MRLVSACVLAVTVACALPTQSHAASQQPPSPKVAEAEVRQVFEELDDAFVRQDAAVYGRILAADAVSIGPDGRIMDREGALAALNPTATKEMKISPADEVRVRVYGNTAVVTAHFTFSGRRDGQPFTDHFRFTNVFVRQDGRWRLVADQGTPVAK